MSEKPSDMLARVQMMAQGDPKWDLSDNDQAALQYLINTDADLRRQLAEAQARIAKLEGALRKVHEIVERKLAESKSYDDVTSDLVTAYSVGAATLAPTESTEHVQLLCPKCAGLAEIAGARPHHKAFCSDCGWWGMVERCIARKVQPKEVDRP